MTVLGVGRLRRLWYCAGAEEHGRAGEDDDRNALLSISGDLREQTIQQQERCELERPGSSLLSSLFSLLSSLFVSFSLSLFSLLSHLCSLLSSLLSTFTPHTPHLTLPSLQVWSLGCILYEMASLRHPFEAGSMKGLVLKIIKGNYPSIPSYYSKGLRNLIDTVSGARGSGCLRCSVFTVKHLTSSTVFSQKPSGPPLDQ